MQLLSPKKKAASHCLGQQQLTADPKRKNFNRKCLQIGKTTRCRSSLHSEQRMRFTSYITGKVNDSYFHAMSLLLFVAACQYGILSKTTDWGYGVLLLFGSVWNTQWCNGEAAAWNVHLKAAHWLQHHHRLVIFYLFLNKCKNNTDLAI